MKPLVYFFLLFPLALFAQLETQQIAIPPKFVGHMEPGNELRVDGQYKVSLFFIDTALVRPRFMSIGRNNVLYVADMKANHIYAIPDFDNDGVGDSAYIVAPDVDSAHSLAIWNDTMYVAEPDRIRKFIDMNHDGIFESETPFITGIHSSGPYNHYTRTIVVDTVNRNIYLSIGASCNACREEHFERGTIMQFSINGFASRVYAAGFRNAIGLAIDPEFNQLWAANADRDYLGDDIPPEIITPVKENGFYGWPFAYGDKVWINFNATSEYQAILPITAADSQKVASMEVAPITVEAHSTPMGILFYNDPRVYIQAPPKTILLARHGSSKGGRPIGYGYDVLRFQQDKDTKIWTRDTFVAGFLTDSINYTYWGRPCGIVEDSTGEHIYLSSDVGKPAIYRISLKDFNKVEPKAEGKKPEIYPNPSRGTFTINSDAARIRVTNMLGSEVIASVRQEESGFKVLIKDVAAGLYFCEITNLHQTYRLPIVIW